MEQMTKKHNETGRIMVEMLGVLAVVGVLSIGGVMGYRYAVDKANANEIVNELSKRAVTASQQLLLGGTINLSEYGNNGAIKGYAVNAIDDYYADEDGFFALELKDVPQKTCDLVVQSGWDVPTEVYIGETFVEEGVLCQEGNNNLTFAFRYDLTVGGIRVTKELVCKNAEQSGSGTPLTSCLNYEINLCYYVPGGEDICTGWSDSMKPDFTREGGDTEKLTVTVPSNAKVWLACRASMFPAVPLEEVGQVLHGDCGTRANAQDAEG